MSFQFRDDANPPSRKSKLARFPYNPEPNWGPKSRAKRRYLLVAEKVSRYDIVKIP